MVQRSVFPDHIDLPDFPVILIDHEAEADKRSEVYEFQTANHVPRAKVNQQCVDDEAAD